MLLRLPYSSLWCSQTLQYWVKDEFWQALSDCVYSRLFLIVGIVADSSRQESLSKNKCFPFSFCITESMNQMLPQLLLALVLWNRVFPWAENLPSRQGLLARRFYLSLTPNAGFTIAGSLVRIFKQKLGTWTQVFRLAQQAILSTEPSPQLQHRQLQVDCCNLKTCTYSFHGAPTHLLQPPFLLLSLQGMMKRCEGEEMFLGQFMYNKAETTVQTFELQVITHRERLRLASSLRGICWNCCPEIIMTKARAKKGRHNSTLLLTCILVHTL